MNLELFCEAAERLFAADMSDNAARKLAFDKMTEVAPPAIRADTQELLPLANDLAEQRPVADADRVRELVTRVADYTEKQCPRK